jgi:CRP/FNR family transcriptional regulator, cyclic AMP receptor protein
MRRRTPVGKLAGVFRRWRDRGADQWRPHLTATSYWGDVSAIAMYKIDHNPGAHASTVFVDSRRNRAAVVSHVQGVVVIMREAGVTGALKLPFDPEAFLFNAGHGSTTSTFEEDKVVFSQGEAADSIFYINKGKLKLIVRSAQGKEAVVAILGPGDFFGEGCLAGQPRRMATAAAMTKCLITRMDKSAMIRVLHDAPDFSEKFMSHLLTRNIRVEADLVDQLFNSSEKRLARMLLILANFGKEGKPEPVIAKVSQEMLAEMIGTTRSRVSFFMNKFRKLGLIDYNGHLEVHSSLLNVVLHDDPHINSDD